ncbi:MAG: hypothetical protein AAGE52_37380 [Myxococcota bacterium]
MRWALVLIAIGCSAPPAEPTCEAYCAQRRRCGDGQSERVCVWACLASIEPRGGRCSRRLREEFACLSEVDDCDFLLNATEYENGDPCAGRGRRRASSCSGPIGEELEPLELPDGG